jgi:DNA-binding response OmpR family regulator
MKMEGGAMLNVGTQQVHLDTTEVTLTMREWQILECLALAAGRIVSRNVIWESVWESGATPDSNLIDVYIRRLREKLGMEAIETVRGTGYRLRTVNS